MRPGVGWIEFHCCTQFFKRGGEVVQIVAGRA